LTPLPCAFSLAGVGGGTALLVAIAAANDYTTVLMVRSASRLGGTGYEEVILAAGGRRALLWCRVALVLLLFGTMCGCLAAIQETGMRAVEALHSHALAHALDPWLLVGTTAIVLLPLSLASLGDLPFVALLGVMMEICLAVYVLALAVHQAIHEANAHGHGSASVGGASYAPDASSYDSYTYGDAANALSAREHADSARALSAHGGGHALQSTPTSALGIPEAAATFGCVRSWTRLGPRSKLASHWP
jgi:amino acid permease